MKISAIICTYNRERYLKIALNALTKQTLSVKNFEVIIVNNNSTDNTKEVCKEFALNNKNINVKYFEETSQGLSFARNKGIKESACPIITFLDDDAYIDKDFLKLTVDAFVKNPDVVALGGKILLDYETKKPAWSNPFLNSLLGYFNLGDKENEFKGKHYSRGSNMSFRKDIFDKTGVFDVRLGRKGGNLQGSEEKELFERFKKNKYRILYVPDAIVYHWVPEQRTTKDFIRRQALGTGQGERKRMETYIFSQKLNYFKTELIRWVASLFIAFGYLLSFKPYKSYMIVMFRVWLLKGLLQKDK